jgi:hypothetical protein
LFVISAAHTATVSTAASNAEDNEVVSFTLVAEDEVAIEVGRSVKKENSY